MAGMHCCAYTATDTRRRDKTKNVINQSHESTYNSQALKCGVKQAKIKSIATTQRDPPTPPNSILVQKKASTTRVI